MAEVSRNQPVLLGHQRKARPGARRVGLAVITYYGGYRAGCSCGWEYGHAREKVREDAIDRHLAKHHDGRGIRV